ncbi:MAG: hypothetical protein GTN69_12415 [Armatimonadetes bacterium]|nr:hypothetical protein [Armatimonadota bacterium]
MASADKKQKMAEWKQDLEAIKNQVLRLYWQRKIYRRILEVVKNNPRLSKGNVLLDWMSEGYVAMAAITVRRLLDKDRRSVSLATLIEKVCRDPEVIDRKGFVAAYPEFMRKDGIADGDFDRFAGPSKATIDPSIIQQKLDATKRECSDITRKYVNKFLAHTARKTPKQIPTFAKLDKAIDTLGELFNELHLLITRGEVLVKLEPTIPVPWEWIFREPWIVAEE